MTQALQLHRPDSLADAVATLASYLVLAAGARAGVQGTSEEAR